MLVVDELPSLLQYGGDMLTYHVNSVMSHPDMLHGMAEKITKYVSGSQTSEENDNSKHAVGFTEYLNHYLPVQQTLM